MQKVYHRVDNIAGNVITVRAPGVKYRELAEVSSRTGTSLAHAPIVAMPVIIKISAMISCFIYFLCEGPGAREEVSLTPSRKPRL